MLDLIQHLDDDKKLSKILQILKSQRPVILNPVLMKIRIVLGSHSLDKTKGASDETTHIC